MLARPWSASRLVVSRVALGSRVRAGSAGGGAGRKGFGSSERIGGERLGLARVVGTAWCAGGWVVAASQKRGGQAVGRHVSSVSRDEQ